MVWIFAVVLVVALLVALAWWSSGRSAPARERAPVDSYTAQAQEQAGIRHNYGGGGGVL